MRSVAALTAAVVLTLLTGGVALADSTTNGNTTETGKHHEFTNCGASPALVQVANCVDLLSF